MKVRIRLPALLAFIALLMMGASPAMAGPKAGGGLELMAAGSTYGQDGTTAGTSVMGIGGYGVSYASPFFRTGLELGALMSAQGTAIRGGFFGDFILGRPANADVYLGLALGLGGGGVFSANTGFYARPQVGVQWNLGRRAIDLRLFSMVAVPMNSDALSVNCVGLSAGLAFGNFPIRPVRVHHRGPPPPPRAAPRAVPPPPRRAVPPPPRRY